MRKTIIIAGGMFTALLTGMLIAPAEAPAEAPSPDMVHVSIVYEESGEARSIELTDDEGNEVPVGSVAEEFPWLDDNTDAEEG